MPSLTHVCTPTTNVPSYECSPATNASDQLAYRNNALQVNARGWYQHSAACGEMGGGVMGGICSFMLQHCRRTATSLCKLGRTMLHHVGQGLCKANVASTKATCECPFTLVFLSSTAHTNFITSNCHSRCVRLDTIPPRTCTHTQDVDRGTGACCSFA